MKLKYSLKVIVLTLCLALAAISLAAEYYQIASEPESKLSAGAVDSGGFTDTSAAADCGVVLTGSPGRIREAFEVLEQKKIKKLIISGVYKETSLNQIFPHLPFYTEISENDVVLEKKSESTYGNAVQSLALVKALKCRNILLITSQLHMFRSQRIFSQVYPSSIEILKMTVSNRKDFNVFDKLLETVKSSFYWALGLVASA